MSEVDRNIYIYICSWFDDYNVAVLVIVQTKRNFKENGSLKIIHVAKAKLKYRFSLYPYVCLFVCFSFFFLILFLSKGGQSATFLRLKKTYLAPSQDSAIHL